MIIKKGDIVLTNLEPVKGSEQGKIRPCLIVQNDLGNATSPVTIVVALTSKTEKEFPFTVLVQKEETGFQQDSLIQCNQIRTISVKERIIKKLGALKPSTMQKVDQALKVSLGIEQ
ncbi:MAG: type II toxin-antitoxin system PemK/MazF family toxin [archaeon]|nr:type II toxin-antitoxin system PemK/MazF family toxin [archaeon]